jgi:hypothetical protein
VLAENKRILAAIMRGAAAGAIGFFVVGLFVIVTFFPLSHLFSVISDSWRGLALWVGTGAWMIGVATWCVEDPISRRTSHKA